MVIFDASAPEFLAGCAGEAAEFYTSKELSHRHGCGVIAFPLVRVYKIGKSDRLP